MKTVSILDFFGQLSSINLTFPGSNYGSAQIYGNGRNQVEVYVTVRILKSNGEDLPITKHDIQKLVYLCDYTTGKKLSSPWEVSDTPGDFVNAVSFGALKGGENPEISASSYIVTVSKFISYSDGYKDGLKIAAGIEIPGVGAFDTSQYGTGTLNGPGGLSGSIYKNPQFLTISAKDKKQYTPSDIKIHNSTKVRFQDDLGYTSVHNSGPSYGHYTAYVLKRTIELSLENGYAIKNYSITPQTKLKNNDLRTGRSINWGGGNFYYGFNAIQDNSDHRPFAVVSASPDDTYHTYFWFRAEDEPFIDGPIFLARSSYRCRAYPWFKDKSVKEDGIITFRVYEFVVPEDFEWALEWDNKFANLIITIWDAFGNTGEFDAIVNNSAHYDNIGL